MSKGKEKLFKRPNIFLKVNGVELDTPQNSNDDKIHEDEIVDNEIELTRSEQWERVNELLLLITTILIFNATSLFIAVIQITWSKDSTTFNKTLIFHSQETIGMSKTYLGTCSEIDWNRLLSFLASTIIKM